MISFMLYNLCKYPQYVEPLTKEVRVLSAEELCSQRGDATPLLDSFLKETARLNPLSIGEIAAFQSHDSLLKNVSC